MRDSLLRKWFRSNSELSDFLQQTTQLHTPNARRGAVKIVAIDDEPFAPQTNLQSYGYKVEPIGDVKNLQEISQYHIVLCHIIGVGRHFSNSLQGASLIAEIKKTYPEKVVIAYTGAASNERASMMALQRADKLIKKDIDIEEWVDTLDNISKDAIDPFVIWKKIRSRLIEMDVSTADILILEDSYVKSILNKDPNLGPLAARAPKIGLNKDVRAIVQGLISSAIFENVFK